MHDAEANGGSGPGLSSRLSWGGGVEAGAARISQELDNGERRDSLNPFVGPVALAELALGGGWR